MSNNGRPGQIYPIIGIGVIGIIALLRWLLSRWGGEKIPTTGEEIVRDNNIIDSSTIPPSCLSFKDAMSCLITHSSDTNSRESFVSYYRETLAAWNMLPLTQLDTACQESLSYITKQISSLSGGYKC